MLIIWDLGWLLTQGLGAGILLESVFGIPFHRGLVLTILIVSIWVAAGGMISTSTYSRVEAALLVPPRAASLPQRRLRPLVRPGGIFDGAAGVAAALEAARMITSSGARFKRPVEVIVFSEEEDGRMAAWLARVHGGSIECRSAPGQGRAGQGSTFTVTLPHLTFEE